MSQVEEKLNKIVEFVDKEYTESIQVDDSDIVTRINKILEQDEDPAADVAAVAADDTDGTTEPVTNQGSDIEEPPVEEVEEPEEPIQLEDVVKIEEYDLETNNAFDFYDYINAILTDEESIAALNIAYEKIPEEKRKLTPALFVYNDAIETVKDKREDQIKGDQDLEVGV